MKPKTLAPLVLLGVLGPTLGGCHHPVRVPLDPIPMHEAIRVVNHNIAKIDGTLKASGSVDGHFTLANSRTRSYHLDGTLFYLAPRYIRFDLKSFGDRKFLFGSNAEYYWYYSKEEETYHCRPHGADEELPSEIPVRPDQIINALGLTPITTYLGAEGQTPPVQRVVDDYQQILFLVHDDRGGVALEKEYWLDRYRPRLVRRVVFRDCEGVVEMESRLDDYRALTPGGPLLPHTMTADWPRQKAQMRFRVGRWRSVRDVGPGGVQFTQPRECENQ